MPASEHPPDTASSTNGWHVMSLGLLLLVTAYFLAPFVYAWPLIRVYGSGMHPRWIAGFFGPVRYLDANVPLYHSLLLEEYRITGIR